MKQKFKWLLALVAMVASVNLMAADPVVLFHETFGDNSGSARAWSDTYSVKSGVTDVYSGVSYTMTNVKQGKNTTGQTKSGLSQSTQNVDAIFEFGPLDVTDYKTLNLSHYWKPGSTKGTYTTKVYFKTSKNGTYTEITHSAVGGSSFVQVSVNIPSAADKCETLYLKIVFNTSNTQAIIDEVELTGVFDGTPPTTPSLSVNPTEIDFGTVDQNAAVPAGQDVEVTFANLTTNDVTASISGDFNISKSGGFTSGDKITVTPKSTTTIGTINGTLTVKATTDDITKTVPVTMTVAAPEVGVSFEKATSAYTDWEFTNFESQQTHSDVTAHTGAYFGTTGGKASGSMVTKAKIAKPGTLQFFISKQSTNTNSSSWKVSVSTDNSEWTQVGEAIDATSMTKGTWTEVNADLTAYSNVYVKIEYAGSTATRCIDDVVFIAPQSYDVTLSTNPASVGTVTAKVNNVEIGAQVEEGQIVTLSAAPNDAHAYRFKEWQSDDVTITDNAFDMPNKAVSITAVFEPLYAVSLTTTGEGSGTATINGGAGPVYVSASDEITLVAENAAGSEFAGWTASNENIIFDDASSASTTALAGAAGTITATFNKKQCTILDTPVLDDPSNVTYSGATLNWGAVDNVGAYILNVKQGEISIVTDEVVIGSTSFAVSELSANTTYSYSVYAMADDDAYCDGDAAEGNFTTADYPAVVLTLSENGSTSTKDGKLNTPITLPTTSTQACDGKVFVGWSENPIEGEAATATLLDATYTFDNPSVLTKTIYAVYAKEEKGTTTWNIATSIVAGEVIVFSTNTSSDYRYTAQTIASNIMPCAASTYSDDKSQITTLGEGTQQYTVGGNSENGFTFATAGGYLYISADKKVDVKNTATTWTCSINGTTKVATISQKYSSDTYYLKFNPNVQSGVSTNPRFTVYKSGQQDIVLYKKTTSASTYSNYCTTCQAAVAAPTFGLAEGNYGEAQTLELTAAEGDIYYTINDGTETKYTAAIVLDKRGTYEISAYAKVDERTSETVTKTYTLDWAYTLAELVDEGAPTTTGRTVTVILTDEVIESFATSGNYINGFNTMVGEQKVQVYCKNSPATWEVGGKVSGTVTCPWKLYNSTWELCPTDWDWASYTAPAKITSLEITGDVDNKNYTAGQKLDFTGLTVTGIYSDATEEDVTADVVWTEVTLTENQVEAIAKATLNNAKTGNVAVNASKTIEGLTVGAKVELSKIEITTEASKKDFFVGRNFNHDGIVVTATYSNGSTSNVTNACDFSTPTLANKGQETVTITYSEGEGQDKKEITTSYTINVKYMNLNDLVAEDIATNTSVKVAFSDVEITGFYKNSSDKRAGVYVNVIGKNGSNIELYSSGTPSATLNDWQEGGKLASKGDYITGTWKYYDGGSVWEIDFGSAYAWSTNIEYTAPEIYPTEISMSIPTATVKQSKSLDLEANFTPANATVLNNLEWSSDNNQVTVAPSQDKKSAKVTVAPDATVGTATITVKVDDKDGNKLSATCVITIQEYSVPRYGLYNGAISEGNYIFKADGEYYYMNNTNNNGRLANVANENNPEIVNNIITTDAETYVWQIAKSGDYWTIKNLATQTYVVSTGSGNASLSDSPSNNTEKWTITYDETNEVYTFANLGRSESTSEPTKCYLRNNNNNGWACYASGTGHAITLYKAGFTPAPALSSLEITGELSQTEYFLGKSVKYEGLSVVGHYSNETSAPITDGIAWSATPASFTELGAQTVTITATVQTKTGEVSGNKDFDVTVVESHQINYGLVTNVNTLYDGATIILGAIYGTEEEPVYAVNQGFYTSNYKYLLAYRSNTENSDLEYENEVMKTANASEITLKKVENGWLLIDENNNYICGAADLSKTTKVEDATVWTISIAEGNAVIAAGNYQFFYNKNSGAERFKTYASTTSTQEPVGIYMKNLVAVRTGLTAGKIGTICYPQAIAAVDGANLYQPNYKDDAVKNIYFSTPDEYKAGLPMIFQADREIMKVVFTGDAVTDPIAKENARGMVGNLTDSEQPIDPGMYIFTQNKLWITGEGCIVDPNRAYVDLSKVPFSDGELSHDMPSGAPRRTICLGNASASTPTGVNNLREGDAVNTAQKFFINGNIVIKNQGQLYNAQGNKLK